MCFYVFDGIGSTMIIKMYSVFARETLCKMQFQGKLAAQAQHCTLHAWWDAEDRFKDTPYWTNVCLPYRNGNDARKITLVVDTVEELEVLYNKYKPYMGATFVEDCAYTVFESPTITGIGLGPIDDAWLEGSELKALSTLKNEPLKN